MKVIAEVGSNQKSLEHCVESIRKAKECGADIVKFQTFRTSDLFGRGVKPESELTVDVPYLTMEAARQGIDFMCTAFSPAGYRAINDYVRAHKVASSEITDPMILETVNSFRKPVYLSTGGATMEEINRALLILRNVHVTLLHCVVAYPARVVDFRHMVQLRKQFGGTCHIGYSDHSTDVLVIPARAKDLGATVIEKHVNFVGVTDTPDAPHSLSTEEFKLMVRNLKGLVRSDETHVTNPWKRKLITLPDGTKGYFRPLVNAG